MDSETDCNMCGDLVWKCALERNETWKKLSGHPLWSAHGRRRLGQTEWLNKRGQTLKRQERSVFKSIFDSTFASGYDFGAPSLFFRFVAWSMLGSEGWHWCWWWGAECCGARDPFKRKLQDFESPVPKPTSQILMFERPVDVWKKVPEPTLETRSRRRRLVKSLVSVVATCDAAVYWLHARKI